MQRLFFPLGALLALILVGYSALNNFHKRVARETASLATLERKSSALAKDNQKASQDIQSVRDEIARGRDFLNEWHTAHARSTRGGIDNTILELATAQEVSIPTPRTQGPSPFLTSELGPITARQIQVQGDGNVAALLRFFSETERTFPLSQTLSIALRAGDRDPKIEFMLALLNRDFAAMPDLAPDAPPADNSGIFGKRPDTGKATIPALPDNLITRGNTKPVAQIANSAADIGKLMPTFKVTGLIWSTEPQARALLANGYVLHPYSQVPSSMVKTSTSTRIILLEITRDMARFQVETEVYNSVTAKSETEKTTCDVPFTIFNDISPEG